MAKSQTLSEARRISAGGKNAREDRRIRAMLLFGAEHRTDALEKLSADERKSLRRQVEAALARERRRANARAYTYDLSRHVNLYLMAKFLAGQQ